MALDLTDLVLRPSEGTLGRDAQVRANLFEVLSFPNNNVYHYDIDIQPAIPSTKRHALWKHFEANSDGIFGSAKTIFDGVRNAFSMQMLNLGEVQALKVDVFIQADVSALPGLGRMGGNIISVTIKLVNTVNMQELQKFISGDSPCTTNCRTALMVLDILIRYVPSQVHFSFGRSIYTPADKIPLPNGAEIWLGYYQSVRPTKGKLMVNIDVSATVMYESGPLPDITAKILNKRSLDELRIGIAARDLIVLTRLLKGRTIQVVHRGERKMTYKITNLASPANTLTFTDGQGVTKTVAEYFVDRYNKRLNYPFLPCVVVKKDIFLPMEVCELVSGQRYTRRLNPKQTVEFIKATSQPPQVRLNKINQGLTVLQHKNNEYMDQFDMSIKQEMEVVKARILTAPRIAFHSSQAEFVAQSGSWSLQGKKLAQSATLGSWSVINFAGAVPFPAIQRFIREFCTTAAELGISVVNRGPIIMNADPQSNIERALKEAYVRAGNSAKANPQLIFCILPQVSSQLYGEIKRVTDTVIGIPSQCMQSKHISNPRKQYCANLSLKVNVKLGGLNHNLKTGEIPFISEKPTIIFGVDVSHSMANANSPSIAAVTASIDSLAARFVSTIRLQKTRTDIVSDLSNIVVELLRKFYKQTGIKPERMLFYRDGVANNQFKEVVDNEVAAIRQACAQLDENYKPTITFVVVQKRHHTRLFPMTQRDAGRSGNCPPGLVVDTSIVHPYEFDFYLQSHVAIKGTARPAHYYVLYDDNGFNPNSLQELTFKLCYLYVRSCGPISIVPAVYYADIVAARARLHRHGGDFSEVTTSDVADMETQGKLYAEVMPELQKTMYFM